MIVLDGMAGTQINERYSLEAVIGRGASGVVYRARDQDGALVALKLVGAGERAEQSARYLRGARLAADLHHPNIVEVHESGRWGPNRSCYYLSMELVEGVPLGRLLTIGLPPEQAVGLMLQVLDAAAYVHARGTVHRDLKPDNVMVVREADGGLVCKVTDFGIASNRLREASVTQTGALVGTPAYMAPELTRARPLVGPECDIYAIGVMLYEFLAGARPFVGAALNILFQKATNDAPPLPDAGRFPPSLVSAVMKLLTRQPEHRTAHARDAMRALAPFSHRPEMDESLWKALIDGENATGHAPTVVGLRDPGPKPTGRGETYQDQTILDGGVAPLWGRDELLERLDAHARRVESGDPQLVLLSGRVGVGKSALMRELSIRLQEAGRFQVLSTSFFRGQGQEGGLRGAVALHLGTRGRSAQTVREAVEEHLRRMGEDDADEAAALEDWLNPVSGSMNSGSVDGASDFSPGVRYLRRLGRNRPVLLLVDDLHCGGGHGAALVEYLLFEFGYEPWDILVLASTETPGVPAFEAGLARSAHAEGKTRHTIPVSPLPTPILTDGLRRLLGLSTARARSFAERAGGNPLVALGLAQAAAATDLTDDPMSTWVADAGSGESPLHTMLSRLLRNALDQLPDVDGARTVLQAVALLGPWVDVPVLAQFLDTPADDLAFETLLDDLVERDVLEEDLTPGQDRVGLKPLALAELILDEVGGRRLKRMRRQAIEVLSSTPGVDHGVLGDHHHALGDPPAALDAWRSAHHRALQSGAPYVAVDHGLKILAAVPEAERAWWGIHLGRVLLDAGDARRAERVLQPVCDARNPDDALVAGDLLCDVYENVGKGADWTALIDRIRDRVEGAGRVGRHAAHCALAMWSTTHSDDRAGRDAAETAMALAESPAEIRRAAQRLAFSCLPGRALERAEDAARQALAASGDRAQMRVRSLRTLAAVRLWRGHVDEALQLNEEALTLARWKGLSLRATLALHDLGDCLRIKGVRTDPTDAARGEILALALERYDACIRGTEALDLESTAYLVRFKQVICRVANDEIFPVESQVSEMVGPAEAAGLGLARPCAQLITAWTRAREGDEAGARAALEGARILESFQIDPQVPDIFSEIRTRLGG